MFVVERFAVVFLFVLFAPELCLVGATVIASITQQVL